MPARRGGIQPVSDRLTMPRTWSSFSSIMRTFGGPDRDGSDPCLTRGRSWRCGDRFKCSVGPPTGGPPSE